VGGKKSSQPVKRRDRTSFTVDKKGGGGGKLEEKNKNVRARTTGKSEKKEGHKKDLGIFRTGGRESISSRGEGFLQKRKRKKQRSRCRENEYNN